MPRKSLKQWIKENREELDRILDLPKGYRNDEERRLWVLNDEGLYLWARSEGVNV